MSKLKIVISAIVMLLSSVASATPIMTLTFDMAFTGSSWKNDVWQGYFTDPLQPLHEQVTVELPMSFPIGGSYTSPDRSGFALWSQNPIAASPSGVSIDAPNAAAVFNSETFTSAALSELGATSLTLDRWMSRDYVNVAKEYYPLFGFDKSIDANIQTVEHIGGVENAYVFTSTRLTGDVLRDFGDITPFTESDVPSILGDIFANGQFTIFYTRNIELADVNGNWTGRASSVMYQGFGRLTAMTFGDLPSSNVPEPSTLLLALLALVAVVVKRNHQVALQPYFGSN
jgi:hypothetical protein